MAKGKRTYWYRANVYQGRLVVYLMLASSITEARIKLGLFAKGRVVERLTWEEIQLITGCEIPQNCKKNGFAYGCLLFRRDSHSWYLWQGND